MRSVDIHENIVTESCSDQHQFDDSLRNADEVSVEFSGKYSLVQLNQWGTMMTSMWLGIRIKKGKERWRNLLSAQRIGKGNSEKARGNEYEWH